MHVYVGLSGGVDSSVAAHLLLKAGHQVTGVFIRTWQPSHVPCTQPDDERSALQAALYLGIPFFTLDLSKLYRNEVGTHFIEGYSRGETPNPDVLCNREVKFGGFLSYALAHGADAVATGHYARVKKEEGTFSLLRGVDPQKDQSYFLSLLSQEQLSHTLFPLGEYTKEEVRRIASSIDLPNAARKDSQGICFLGAIDLEEFLSAYIDITPGVVLDQSGMPIGTHRGAPLYTLGERHGFTIEKKSGNHDEPLYISAINVSENTVTAVSQQNLPSYRRLRLRDVVDRGAQKNAIYQAQVRYHGGKYSAQATQEHNGWIIVLKEGVLVSPGQTVVLYENDTLVLAGILTEVA